MKQDHKFNPHVAPPAVLNNAEDTLAYVKSISAIRERLNAKTQIDPSSIPFGERVIPSSKITSQSPYGAFKR